MIKLDTGVKSQIIKNINEINERYIDLVNAGCVYDARTNLLEIKHKRLFDMLVGNNKVKKTIDDINNYIAYQATVDKIRLIYIEIGE